jgi:hypothetical protein
MVKILHAPHVPESYSAVHQHPQGMGRHRFLRRRAQARRIERECDSTEGSGHSGQNSAPQCQVKQWAVLLRRTMA